VRPALRPALRLAATLAVPAAVVGAVLWRSAPPAPLPESAPATSFSATRALRTVRELAGDGAPRPVGSAANGRVVDDLLGRLRALGLEPEVQRTFACGIYGTCALVRNVIARVGPPAAGRRTVALVAHHDSVGAGPGAADDLSGVAIALEVARALAAGPPPPRPVLLVLTDGEEAGLVGASAFVERHPAAREIGAAVNVEARGTTGPSFLFDTSGAPSWLADALDALPHPVTTSVAPAVYRILPNDTDLTVFDRAGLPGVNLAFPLGVVRYHTPLDDVAHLDPASVQHQGESALALVRALAESELEAGAGDPRAWFDVLSLGVLSWPTPREVALVAAALALLAALAIVAREPRPVRAVALGAAAALVAPLVAGGAALALVAALRLAGAMPRPFVAHPLPILLAGWLAGGAGALLAPALLGRAAGRPGLLAGAAVVQAAATIALAILLPLATPVFAVPALAFAVAEPVRAWSTRAGRRASVADLLPSVAAGLVISPLALYLPSLLGVGAVPASAALFAFVLSPAASAGVDGASPRRHLPGLGALAGAALAAAVQAALPHATPSSPQRLSLAYQEGDGAARWLAEAEGAPLPRPLRDAARFSASAAPAFPWTLHRSAFSAPAPALGLAPPRIEVVSSQVRDGRRRLTLRLWSPRGAPELYLVLPAAARATATLDGLRPPELSPLARAHMGDHRVLASLTAPRAGHTIELELEGAGPIDLVAADRSPGLPREGAPLAAARPPSAVPSYEGDSTWVTARLRL
jgi:hypothetical protein